MTARHELIALSGRCEKANRVRLLSLAVRKRVHFLHMLVLRNIKSIGLSFQLSFICANMSALWDYENWLLSRYDVKLGMPVGLGRLTHEPWVRHVKNDLPNSDFTWEQYVKHVEANDGDDWFFECPDDLETGQ